MLICDIIFLIYLVNLVVKSTQYLLLAVVILFLALFTGFWCVLFLVINLFTAVFIGLQVFWCVLYLVINLFTTVPLHNGVQRRTQESAVPVSLVLSAVGHCVCDITEYLEHKMIQVHVHKQVYCVYLYLHTQLATF